MGTIPIYSIWCPLLPARYYRELLAFLTRMVNDRDRAADLAQESYARILAVERAGETVGEPRAFLYRTARNLVVDQHRRADVRNQWHADHDGLGEAGDAVPGPASWQPEVAASSAQGVSALLDTIAALPPRAREALVLHKFDGLSQSEVAQAMGISLTMVERHIKLALEACRRCRDADGGPSDSSHP